MLAILDILWNWICNHPELATQLATLAVLLGALLLAISTLRSMRRDRTTSLAMNISESYDSGIIREARNLIFMIQNEQEKLEVQDKQSSFLNILEYYRQNYPVDVLCVEETYVEYE